MPICALGANQDQTPCVTITSNFCVYFSAKSSKEARINSTFLMPALRAIASAVAICSALKSTPTNLPIGLDAAATKRPIPVAQPSSQ